MLLDCEEIIQEWQNWRTVNEAYFSSAASSAPSYEIPQAPLKAFAGSSSSATAIPLAQSPNGGQSTAWRQDLLQKQDSHPPNAVQKAYAHPAWIPLARDWGGNNICVDLAPGPTGKWGQIILMGRDYDCKYVISRSWSAFLATVADDMGSGKWFIDEDTKELKLRVFKEQGVEPAYIDILRWRTDQKYGRRRAGGGQGRRGPLRINSNVAQNGQANGLSPYASPTGSVGEEGRGRSPHRMGNGKAPAGGSGTSSPRGGGHMVGSPLARVTEEPQSLNQGLKLDTTSPPPSLAPKADKLISVDTPKAPQEGFDQHPVGENAKPQPEQLVPITPLATAGEEPAFPPKSSLSAVTSAEDDEASAPLVSDSTNGVKAEEPKKEDDGEMKDVAI